jgi:hypothetical protein
MKVAGSRNAAIAPGGAREELLWLTAPASIQRLLPAIALTCAFLAGWVVQHAYRGIVHDSEMYLIQALARLNPEFFAHDIFLRYGSQDRFTVFSPLFAAAMQLFGVEAAARALTLLAQVGFFAATAMLARMLMPPQILWPSLALVCMWPTFYGPGRILAVVEDFATPRLFAEAFVVVALIAFLSRRFWLAAAFGLAGLFLHPLMATGGVVVALCSSFTPARIRVRLIVTGLLCAGVLLAWMHAQDLPLRFDDEWLWLLQSGLKYLWVSEWSLVTWSPLLVSLITLAIGAVVLERSRARSLCKASLIAALGGIVLAYLGGDVLHIVPVVQGQPYRWLWLSMLLSLLLLPLIVTRTWLREGCGKTATLLLISAWLCMSEPYGIAIAALALVASIVAMNAETAFPQRIEKLTLVGAGALLMFTAVYQVATSLLFAEMGDVSDVPPTLQNIRTLARTGALPVTAFILVYLAMLRLSSSAGRIAVTVGCAVVLTLLVPASVHEWTLSRYGRDREAFAEWRALIPPRTEVLWFDSPVAAWVLLERPSYLSNTQETSGLFSRPAAMAMKRRVDLLDAYLASERNVGWRNESDLDETKIAARAAEPVQFELLCATAPDLYYVVTSKAVLAEPIAAAPRAASSKYRPYKLYRCEHHG